MRGAPVPWLLLSLCLAPCPRLWAQVENGDFETGDFAGWVADPNWVVDSNSCGAYSGWRGGHFAWSGGQGEAATGTLRSQPFVLDRGAVRLLVAGWNTAPGSGRLWNHIVLRLADGTEIDRRTAPNSLSFRPIFLDGSGHQGEPAYIEAIDDADMEGFSMFCIDDVRTTDQPASGGPLAPPLPEFDARESVALEDDLYRVEVSRQNGAITRILDKVGGLDLIREPRLAGNYMLSLPIPGGEPWETIEANYVVGREQSLSSVECDGNRLVVRWDKVTSWYAGPTDVAVTMTVELADGGIVLSLQVRNQSPFSIGEVYFPVLGGLQGLGQGPGALRSTLFARPAGQQVATDEIFTVFANQSPLGAVGSEQFYAYPESWSAPWAGFRLPGARRSVYIGAMGAVTGRKALHLELLPGSSGTTRWNGNWPRAEELRGQPVGVVFSIVDFANQAPGGVYDFPPIVVRFHDGDWTESQRIYEATLAEH